MSEHGAQTELPADVIDELPPPQKPSLAPTPQPQPKVSSLMKVGERGVQLSTVEEMLVFSKAVINSGLAPYGFKSPEAVLVAIQFGAELGLPPMSALQNIAVINGRPALWGDAVPGLANVSGLLEDAWDEEIGNRSDDTHGFQQTVIRRGRSKPFVRKYTVADAKIAGLWGKRGESGKPTPWVTAPDRMLFNRARAFAYRDAFPEVYRGLYTAEEVQDIPPEPKNVTRSLDEIDK